MASVFTGWKDTLLAADLQAFGLPAWAEKKYGEPAHLLFCYLGDHELSFGVALACRRKAVWLRIAAERGTEGGSVDVAIGTHIANYGAPMLPFHKIKAM